ncbi:hypothetical protein [Arthrobacter dokdonensis]|uniref:hypothetical protein n=1 Tax=Arthrobacter dokdonellae TaxID=2211210 RepID=UPI000DE59545|nr:hypothetical protein [Arthrobacter dokdonellae]
MRDQTPPDRAAAGRLRPLPGFRAAVVVFLATVLVGGGTIAAVANWQQSATATIAITAGGRATPPPAANVVTANPVLDPRPAVLDPEQVTCQPDPAKVTENAAGIKFTWPAAARATSYVVSLAYDDKGYSYPGAATVTAPTATFTLQRTAAAYGHYVLRVLPMNGAVAGDPIYRTYNYFAATSSNCYDARPDGRSPLAVPVVSAQALVKGATTAALPLSWTGAAGTSYVVTLVAAAPGYGMETTVGGGGITVTFPRPANGQGAPYYANYSLRIQPVNGTTVGDAVYKTVQYYDWGSGLY